MSLDDKKISQIRTEERLINRKEQMLGLVLFNIFIKDLEWGSQWHINRNAKWHQIYRITKCAHSNCEEKEHWSKYKEDLNMRGEERQMRYNFSFNNQAQKHVNGGKWQGQWMKY